jgi:hypothetical protein
MKNRKFIAALVCSMAVVALALSFATSTSAVHAAPHPTSIRASASAFSVASAATSASSVSPSRKTTYVYVTKTGKKYHRAGCRYLKYSKRKVTLKWAKANHYTACKVCKPPK